MVIWNCENVINPLNRIISEITKQQQQQPIRISNCSCPPKLIFAWALLRFHIMNVGCCCCCCYLLISILRIFFLSFFLFPSVSSYIEFVYPLFTRKIWVKCERNSYCTQTRAHASSIACNHRLKGELRNEIQYKKNIHIQYDKMKTCLGLSTAMPLLMRPVASVAVSPISLSLNTSIHIYMYV